MTSHVVITGANRGIGLALVKQYQQRFSEQGPGVVFALCRKASPALTQLPVNVIEGIDITQAASIEHLQTVLKHVTVDILINNAGIWHDESLEHIDFSAIQAQFDCNALGPLRVSQALLPNMTTGAKIAMISSRMGSIHDNSSGGRYGYRMSKAALNCAGVSLARDVADRGIAVGILHPGWVATDMINGRGNLSADQAAQAIIMRIDALNMKNSSNFWHADGSILPW